MAITPATKKEDDRLRDLLKNADMKKFDKAVKAALNPTPKKSPKRK